MLTVLFLLINVFFKNLEHLFRVIASLNVDNLESSVHACLGDLLILIEASLDDEEVKDLFEGRSLN